VADSGKPFSYNASVSPGQYNRETIVRAPLPRVIAASKRASRPVVISSGSIRSVRARPRANVSAGGVPSTNTRPGIAHRRSHVVRELQQDLAGRGVELVLAHVQSDLKPDPDRHHLTEAIGPNRIYDSLHEALTAYHGLDLEPRH
jgi:hypothetical protein